jgi:ABC-type antimicrobial peptide transport system permease subunit
MTTNSQDPIREVPIYRRHSSISPEAVGGAFLFSLIVGVFFGLYPANKASKMNPSEALHYE